MQKKLRSPKASSIRPTCGQNFCALSQGAPAGKALDLLAKLERTLGVEETRNGGDDAEIEALVAEREAARAAKDWAESDRIRDELQDAGVLLRDGGPGGATEWSWVPRASAD